MARQRRGGSGSSGSSGSTFRTPELRGTLGTLLRTTLQQAGTIRDAIERGAREGRSRLDEARTARRRIDALAELGEIVLDLIRRDEIDLSELPEAADIVRYLDELDADAHSDHDDDDERFAKPPTRSRFDARGRPTTSSRSARPSRPPAIEPERDDGTVSSSSSFPSSTRPAASAQRVWRPPIDDDDTDSDADVDTKDPAPQRRSPAFTRDPNRKGGIRFDDDEDDSDLADYMHPDDVPPKPPSDGES
jgi:hypothetical protein